MESSKTIDINALKAQIDAEIAGHDPWVGNPILDSGTCTEEAPGEVEPESARRSEGPPEVAVV